MSDEIELRPSFLKETSKKLLSHFLKCMRSWSTSFKMEGVLILADCVHLCSLQSYGYHKRNLCTGNIYRHLLEVLRTRENRNLECSVLLQAFSEK